MGMTIAIKGFEMPPSCNHCNLCKKGSATDYGQFGDCILMDKRVNLLTWNKDDDCPLTEAIQKDQYEARLKADLVAILTEIQLEIEETAKDAHINAFMNEYKDMYLNGISASAIKCSEIIQQKINSLKEGT